MLFAKKSYLNLRLRRGDWKRLHRGLKRKNFKQAGVFSVVYNRGQWEKSHRPLQN